MSGTQNRESRRERQQRQARQREARAQEQRRETRNRDMREGSTDQLEEQMGLWLDELGPNPSSNEVPISPLGVDAKVTTEFGAPRTSGPHTALDMAPAERTNAPVDVVNALSGKVLFVGDWDLHSGNTVFVGGDDGLIYSYCHLYENSQRVQVGQRVAQGVALARMGNTGEGSGPHLHYVVRAPQQVIDELPAFMRNSDLVHRISDWVEERSGRGRRLSHYDRVPLRTEQGIPGRNDRIPAGSPLIPEPPTSIVTRLLEGPRPYEAQSSYPVQDLPDGTEVAPVRGRDARSGMGTPER